jgi:hypothetical protein
MIERVFAALVLAVCAVLLVRLVIGSRRRYRFDAAVRKFWNATRRKTTGSWRTIVQVHRNRAAQREAARVAKDAIERARSRGDWDGNVYTPKSFGKPPRDSKPPRDKMH